MDAQTALIIWAIVAYIGFLAVYICDGGGLDVVAAAFWPLTLLAITAVLLVVLPAEGVKWCIRRCKGGR